MTSSNNPHVPSHLVGADGELMSKPNPIGYAGHNSGQASENSLTGNHSNDEGAGDEHSQDDPAGVNASESSVGLFQEESPQGEIFPLFPRSPAVCFLRWPATMCGIDLIVKCRRIYYQLIERNAFKNLNKSGVLAS